MFYHRNLPLLPLPLQFTITIACIIKQEMVVIDDPSLKLVSSIKIVSDDATIWSITYDRHYDDRNSFTIQATGILQYF